MESTSNSFIHAGWDMSFGWLLCVYTRRTCDPGPGDSVRLPDPRHASPTPDRPRDSRLWPAANPSAVHETGCGRGQSEPMTSHHPVSLLTSLEQTADTAASAAICVMSALPSHTSHPNKKRQSGSLHMGTRGEGVVLAHDAKHKLFTTPRENTER